MISCYLRKRDNERLEVIQRSALRAIFKLKIDTPLADLNKLHNLDLLEKRFTTLNKNYIKQGIKSSNPLILDRISSFKLNRLGIKIKNTLLGEVGVPYRQTKVH